MIIKDNQRRSFINNERRKSTSDPVSCTGNRIRIGSALANHEDPNTISSASTLVDSQRLSSLKVGNLDLRLIK